MGSWLTWGLVSIKARRFLELGYSENDVGQLGRHREVSVSKLMSDRGKSWHYRTPGRFTDI